MALLGKINIHYINNLQIKLHVIPIKFFSAHNHMKVFMYVCMYMHICICMTHNILIKFM